MDLIERNEQNINRHPWEISRAESILGAYSKQIRSDSIVMDVGCGDIYFSKELNNKVHPKIIHAVDSNFDDSFTDQQNIKIHRNLNLFNPESMDFIFAMDVIEHVEDDLGFLKKLTSLLRPEGNILITVPAHQYLFSAHDTYLKHFRRYSRKNLIQVVDAAGLHVDKIHYFYFSLYFVRLLQKFTKNLKSGEVSTWGHARKSIVTRMVISVLNADFIFCRILKFVPGLSLCLVCQKKSSSISPNIKGVFRGDSKLSKS